MAVIRSQYTKNLEERLAKKESFAQAHKGAVEQSRISRQPVQKERPSLLSTIGRLLGRKKQITGIIKDEETGEVVEVGQRMQNAPPSIMEIARDWNIRS